MELETLFTSSKWDILQVLSKGPKSPLELANETNTSIANISQQLRLLELGGLVNKKRKSNRDRDQPRLIYSLAGHRSFIITLSEGFVKKGFIEHPAHQQITTRTWFTKDNRREYFVEKYFWTNIEEHIEEIKAIGFRNEYTTLKLFIVTEKDLKNKIKKETLRKASMSVEITPTFYTTSKTGEIPREDLEIIYDPQNLLRSNVEVNST